MCKIKTALVFILTAALIAALSAMPRIVATITDLANNQTGSAPMKSVELEFNEAEELDPGHMIARLALQKNMSTIPITASQALLTETEVYAAAEKQMQAYCDAGIVSWFDYTYRSAQPYLAMDPDNTDNFGIFWGVDYVFEDEPYRSLFIHLDDATGKILLISHHTEEIIYPVGEQHYVFEPLVSNYFRQLGLELSSDYFQSLIVEILEFKSGDDTTVVSYHFQEIQYGDIIVEFHVNPNGFNIYFPS